MEFLVPLDGTELKRYYETKNIVLIRSRVMIILVTRMGQYFNIYIKTKVLHSQTHVFSAKPGKLVCSFLLLICVVQEVYFQNLSGVLWSPLRVFKKLGKI